MPDRIGNGVIIEPRNSNRKASQMVKAFQKLDENINSEVEGQFGQTVIIKTTNHVEIRNSELDCEFETDFDDDTEANEANITIYNLSNQTINNLNRGSGITITAGYKNDTGVIFSGVITSKKTYIDGVDRITEVRAIDDRDRSEKTVESISYTANTKASYILRDLCNRVGLPIAVFKTVRDYTYTDEVTVDGSLSDAVKQYATVCGVSAYICKSKIYVRPLKDGDNTRFKLSADTGLLSVAEFEERSDTEEYTDVIKGFEVEMLLQHRIQTASIIELDSREYKGTFRVREGTHSYNGTDFITKAKIISV